MNEIWKPVKGYEEYYLASNMGNIKSIRNNIILKPNIISTGYYAVKLSVNGDTKDKYIHRLVAKSFIPNPKEKPEVNHIDGNPLNNNIDNLEWVTHKENMTHAVKNGLNGKGENSANSYLTEKDVIGIRKDYSTGNFTQKELGKKYSTSDKNISAIVNRNRWKHVI